jgi:hypothetical protein
LVSALVELARVTVRSAVDRFLGSLHCRKRTAHRSYAGTLDGVAERIADRPVGDAAASTWNQRAATSG